jgi:hypothetical protein
MSSVTFPNFFSPWLPPSVNERFNNGWTFGNLIVTAANSKAPDVERDVVSRCSYGRQLGRLMDAVVALAKHVEATADPHVEPLIALAREIDAIKARAQRRRCDELLEELKALKKNDRKAWNELIKAVGP